MDVVGIGTSALAVFTGALAFTTWRLARSSSEQVEQIRAQAEKASRPVLVPYQRAAETVVFRGGTIEVGTGPHVVENPPGRSDLPHYNSAMMAFQNVGMGPAINVRGTFTGPYGAGVVRVPTEAIAVGACGVVAFENWAGDSLNYTGGSSVSAVVTYEDVAGHSYRTSVTFDAGDNAYRATIEVVDPRPAD